MKKVNGLTRIKFAFQLARLYGTPRILDSLTYIALGFISLIRGVLYCTWLPIELLITGFDPEIKDPEGLFHKIQGYLWRKQHGR